MKQQTIVLLLVLTVGLALGVLLSYLVFGQGLLSSPAVQEHEQASDEPLYWVAPMDANYRRDKPGLSPMGMDLVPVYENKVQEGVQEEVDPHSIYISPDVVNNLGVRTAEVGYGSLESEILTVAYVRYDEDKLIHIHPRVEGWIDRLYVKASGDPVVKGEPLYALYSPELVNAQEEFVLALKRGNKHLIQGTINRLRALQFPEAFIQELQAGGQIKQTVVFSSPQSGVVDNLNIREGFYVQPGTTLFSIGALDTVWVEAEVFERQAALVEVGQPVRMSLDYLPGKQWLGQVAYIYPTVDEYSRTVTVRIEFDNASKQLKPNMFARLRILSHKAEDAVLLIDKEALIRTGSQNRVVLDLGQGYFKSVAVTVGRFGSSQLEVVDGLEQGDRIVTSAQFLLDSESSKNSDFKRLHPEPKTEQENKFASATVEGVINSVDTQTRVLNISRGPIEKWQRPAMTMDFHLSPRLKINDFEAGERIRFRFEIRHGDFVLTNLILQLGTDSTLQADKQGKSQGAVKADRHGAQHD